MNNARDWLRWLGLAPLPILAATTAEAAWFSGLFCIGLIIAAATMQWLRKLTDTATQWFIGSAITASVIALFCLIVQAYSDKPAAFIAILHIRYNPCQRYNSPAIAVILAI